MSYPEYILTDLPQYVTPIPRSQFSKSLVKPGGMLVFSEDGKTLTALTQNRTFVALSGGNSSAVPDMSVAAYNPKLPQRGDIWGQLAASPAFSCSMLLQSIPAIDMLEAQFPEVFAPCLEASSDSE